MSGSCQWRSHDAWAKRSRGGYLVGGGGGGGMQGSRCVLDEHL